jgi:hypothetical protein
MCSAVFRFLILLQTLLVVLALVLDGVAVHAVELADLPTVRLSPRSRAQAWDPGALSALRSDVLEPFLSQALVVEIQDLETAPRIVAAPEYHVMISRGDRAYAVGSDRLRLDAAAVRNTPLWRLYRNAQPLKDPVTQQVLGFEAHYLGKAVLQHSESQTFEAGPDGRMRTVTTPARIEIINAKEEIRTGDRMLPEPERLFLNLQPRTPDRALVGRIVSVYGSAVLNAAQNQVVSLNLGQRDGLQAGDVLGILKDASRVQGAASIRLPDEPNGWLLVFRTFERISYGLIMDTVDGVRVGDRLHTVR